MVCEDFFRGSYLGFDGCGKLVCSSGGVVCTCLVSVVAILLGGVMTFDEEVGTGLVSRLLCSILVSAGVLVGSVLRISCEEAMMLSVGVGTSAVNNDILSQAVSRMES